MSKNENEELWAGLVDATEWIRYLANRISPETRKVIIDSPRYEKLRKLIIDN